MENKFKPSNSYPVKSVSEHFGYDYGALLTMVDYLRGKTYYSIQQVEIARSKLDSQSFEKDLSPSEHEKKLNMMIKMCNAMSGII